MVAEGVESELTLELLEEIGCDIGQGFLFSRPLPLAEFQRLLESGWSAAPPPRSVVPAPTRRRLTVAG